MNIFTLLLLLLLPLLLLLLVLLLILLPSAILYDRVFTSWRVGRGKTKEFRTTGPADQDLLLSHCSHNFQPLNWQNSILHKQFELGVLNTLTICL